MKRIFRILFIGLLLIFVSGCEGKDSMENITIYTSIYPIEYISEELYGEHSSILSFYPSDVDPYEYKLSAKQIKDYSTSDLIIYNGLDNEKDYIAQMINKNKKLKIIDATAKLEYTNSMDELWINPSNMLTIANNTRNGLEEYIDSSYIEKEIDENYENLKLELSTIDAELKEVAENAKDKNIIVADDDLKVLSKYGFNIISVDEDSVTDKDLADTKTLLNNDTVSYIFVKKGYEETDILKDLRENYGAEYLTIDTLNSISAEDRNSNKDYITIMEENIDNIKEEVY